MLKVDIFKLSYKMVYIIVNILQHFLRFLTILDTNMIFLRTKRNSVLQIVYTFCSQNICLCDVSILLILERNGLYAIKS